MSAPVGEQRVITARPGTALRRSVFWIAAAAFALVVSIIGILVAGSMSTSDPLAADNPAPAGAKALVEVLRQQGVAVEIASSLDEAEEAVGDAASATLFYYDPDSILDSEQRTRAFAIADTLVAVNPTFDQLADISPDVAQAGAVEGEATAECDLRAATNADSITSDGFAFRYIGTDDSAVQCFDTGDDAYSLVRVPHGDGTANVVGATRALSNEFVADRGNAAFGLTLLGENPTLVWYIPTVEDLTTEAPPTLGELSPGWVLPATALVLLTALASAVWRGRRFGPLIVENLPVTVRANETMQGRARLYEKSSARMRAIDSLRIGAVQRIAALCGLPRVATVDDVIAAAAAVARIDPAEVRHVLLDAAPATDRDLVRLSDDLLTLERSVATSVTPT
jgi:hypothetical protein